jgi:hypothetical protein
LNRIAKRGRVLETRWRAKGCGCLLSGLTVLGLVWALSLGQSTFSQGASGSGTASYVVVIVPGLALLLVALTIFRRTSVRIDADRTTYECVRWWGFYRQRTFVDFSEILQFSGSYLPVGEGKQKTDTWEVNAIRKKQRVVLSAILKSTQHEEAQLFRDLCSAMVGVWLGDPLPTEAVKRKRKEETEALEKKIAAVNEYSGKISRELPQEWSGLLNLCARTGMDLDVEVPAEIAELPPAERLDAVAENLARREGAADVLRGMVPIGWSGAEDAAILALARIDSDVATGFVRERTEQALAFCRESGYGEPLEAVIFAAARVGIPGLAEIAGDLLDSDLPLVRRIALTALLLGAEDADSPEGWALLGAEREHARPVTRRKAAIARAWLSARMRGEVPEARGTR